MTLARTQFEISDGKLENGKTKTIPEDILFLFIN